MNHDYAYGIIMFSEIFSLGEFHQIFFCQCVHAINLPNFSTAKVSLHTVKHTLNISNQLKPTIEMHRPHYKCNHCNLTVVLARTT